MAHQNSGTSQSGSGESKASTSNSTGSLPPISSPKPPAFNVLLIEEDPAQTELFSDLILEVGECQVDVISRLKSPLDWIGRFNYHLAIIDAVSVMPIAAGRGGPPMDGLGLLEKIKRASPMTSVILISGQASVEEAVSAIRMGAEDYFQRPVNLELFRLAVKRGLDRKIVFGNNTGASQYLHLMNACQMISSLLEQEKIFEVIQSYIGRELHSDHSAIYSLSGTEAIRLNIISAHFRKDRAMEEILDIALQASNPLLKMVDLNQIYTFIDRGKLTPGLFIFRFRCAGDLDYFCVCLSPERPSVLVEFESRLRMLRAQIEVTGKNIENYKGVQQLAFVDDVTGLYNTRYLNRILEREITQAKSANQSFAVLFIDADKFKETNDRYGHLVGSKLLNELGNHLKNYVRDSDTVFRYGGDEFVAVLSPSDLSTANSVAERIRQSVEKTAFLAREGLNFRFTVSIGVALFPEHAKSKKEIIDAADQAMYSAKRSMRNCVFTAEIARDQSSKQLSKKRKEGGSG